MRGSAPWRRRVSRCSTTSRRWPNAPACSRAIRRCARGCATPAASDRPQPYFNTSGGIALAKGRSFGPAVGGRPMRVRASALVFAFLLALAVRPAAAEDENDVLRSLKFQTGNITLARGIATLSLSQNFVYLDPADTETFLTKLWDNPPGTGADTLGMLLPKDVDALGPN